MELQITLQLKGHKRLKELFDKIALELKEGEEINIRKPKKLNSFPSMGTFISNTLRFPPRLIHGVEAKKLAEKTYGVKFPTPIDKMEINRLVQMCENLENQTIRNK